mmetsp:Transcript_32025/g.47129  ORF Transcript_32025/g.47129 Transcript_32025/m.47129 type:complete len:752 (-) Transcript_32025:576-2831(-)|eukprot:CAMPEP_0195509592 /NCGR_PEP_ID=MMETSP0794_2-20130614/2485_1 /TAXON_ID=515487 /ORGANISM="Stephanopyxis turris, Strain CCMP 815" /LENGTH=751 /DNA_ID=CAMNT_0040636853 /DNA_START=31 /DNA_END=2286 /DNA_ORIENTATION=+
MSANSNGATRQTRRPSTFYSQNELPRLPIPPLSDTLERLSRAVEPLLQTNEERTKAQSDISNFLTNEGPHLQSVLEEYDKEGRENNSIGSYIEEFWSDAYLAPDTSVVLNLNPFFLLEDDPDAKNKDQILRASSLTFNSLKFASNLKNEIMPADTFRGFDLCMDQFRSIFGSSRKPKINQKDVVEVDMDSCHVAVLFRNQFYYFQGLWPTSENDGESVVAVSEVDIAHILKSIVEDGKKKDVRESVKSALGVLTTLPRKAWAKVRDNLIRTSEHNEIVLQVIDSALFVLVLDEFVPKSVHEAAANMLHGTHVMAPDAEAPLKEYQAGTCCNRWYDKLQIICCSDGSAGVNFEHSAIDGHTALRFASDVFAETVVAFAKSITKSIHTSACPIPSILDANVIRASEVKQKMGGAYLDTNPKALSFDIVEKVRDQIFFAESKLGDEVSANDTHVLEFNNFGKSLIVANKFSPDSVVQMSMLLSYYRLYGEIVCAYEPVLTKRYFHGRTEAMRSTTTKAAELCACWTDQFATKQEKLEALREATSYHSKLVKEASHGKGVDRHLFALKCIAEKKKIPLPEFFQSQAWNALNHTVLSTSNCGNPALRLFGFGPVVPDGFGIGYIIKDSGIQYSISSKHRQTRRYAHVLNETLLEIGEMLEPLNSQVMGYHLSKSKQQQISTPQIISDFPVPPSIQSSGTYSASKADSRVSVKQAQVHQSENMTKTPPSRLFVGRSYRRESSISSDALDTAGTQIKD